MEIKNKTKQKKPGPSQQTELVLELTSPLEHLQKVIEFNTLEARNIIREFEVPKTCLSTCDN